MKRKFLKLEESDRIQPLELTACLNGDDLVKETPR